MAKNTKGRRDFMGMALGGFTALGGIGALYAMKRTWDPLPSVKAAGFTTIDLKDAQDNVLVTEKWRGKPIFVLKQSKEMMAKATDVDKKRLIAINGAHYMVCVGLCTHLGCIPGYNPEDKSFLCACHGGTYDDTGMVTKAPPPRGLDIPPFRIDGTKLVLGETGPEYEKMLADGTTLPV
ncbi:ubiquinol-cytochrome c reductase iron-sulfur subunit [Sulfurovum sp. NBC37-1]|uniref:ubiquinol-cytochrome c reductase iron-sulfur subunit n=1 Tax=Sulfurovum sp. (strain NBC37-1) TaxID=387093 RepID=UPI00015874FF|nr:ubiquinol-cytochrome c reductase iron-sulfur subunit [Sulfurovum sp. NBC37-1]BAF71168.1 ubiquinol-cytochrome c oxidoreductase, iron-sulfur subunit [Sulfurovum sp. NBC37-1]